MTFQSPKQRRHLLPALALSLVLHILLLWPAPTARQAGDAAVPLTALLRPAAAPKPVVKTPAPTHRSPSTPAVVSQPAATAVDAVPAPIATSSSTPPIAGRSDIPAAAVPTPPADIPAGDSIDGDGLRGYRIALAREARRYKRYPVRALEAEWAGTAELRVSVAAGGQPQEVQLARSSGHDLLDAAALEMLRRALPVTRVPDSLRGRAFSVDLPVVFELPE